MADYDRTPAVYNIAIKQGDYFSWPLVLPFDITDYTISGYVRTGNASKVDFSITKTSPSTGALVVYLAEAQTSLLSGVYRYCIKWEDQTGKIRTIFVGNFEVMKDE